MGAVGWTRRAWCGAASAFAAGRAEAQGSEPRRIIVNFPPGGQLDGIARLLADRALRDGLGPVVVENRPGAGGNIGATAAARARPDGRTVLASIDTPFTVNPHLYKDLGFDPARDLEPVALLSSFPLALVAHPGAGFAGLAGFLAAAGKRPIFYSSAGIGSPGHLAMEHLRQRASLPAGALEHAPLRGNTEALTAVLSGSVEAGFLAVGGGPDLVRSGRLRALAMSGVRRDPALPETPTVAEAGLPGFDVRIGVLLLAPRGVPDGEAAAWAALARGVLADPATATRLSEWGANLEAGDAGAAAEWLRTGRARWGEVVRVAGMRLE